MVEEDRRVLVEDVDEREEDGEEEERGARNESAAAGLRSCETSCLSIVHLASVVAAIGGVLFGYDVGVISGAKVQVAHEMQLTCGQEEALVSLMPLGAVSASLVAGRLLNTIGRKLTIQLTALTFTFGALVMAFAPSLALLLIGRFVVGFAVSLSAMSECLYISEIADRTNRGMLVTLNELGITIGFLLAYLVNYIFMATPGGWRVMFGLSAGLAVLQFVAMIFLPKTPHFLLLRRQEAAAVAVLRQIHGVRRTAGVSVKQEVANIRHSCEEAQDSSCSRLFSTEDNMRRRLFIGVGLVVLQQVTGQPNILYYAEDLFQAVGFCGDVLSAMAAVGLGLVKVGATVVSLCLVDRLGRRTLLLLGSLTMAACLLVLTVFAGYQYALLGYHRRETCSYTAANSTADHVHRNAFSHSDYNITGAVASICDTDSLPAGLRYIAFAALVTYVAAYSLSFGPITWILLSELFPVSLKSDAMSLGQAANWCANVFVSVTFLDAIRLFTLPAVFAFYLLMGLVSVVFIYLTVPETKGKSLEQISKELRRPEGVAAAGGHDSAARLWPKNDFMMLADSSL